MDSQSVLTHPLLRYAQPPQGPHLPTTPHDITDETKTATPKGSSRDRHTTIWRPLGRRHAVPIRRDGPGTARVHDLRLYLRLLLG